MPMCTVRPAAARDFQRSNEFRSLKECRAAARELGPATSQANISWFSICTAFTALGCSLVALVFTSMYVVGAIHAPTDRMNVSESFIGLVVIPSILASLDQITSALRSNREGIAWIMETTFSSGIRISLFVLPIAIVFGWALGTEMDMVLDGFQVVVLALAILLVNQVIHNGVFHWLEGTIFIAAFLLFSIAALYYPNHA